jgi:hypothetical protein
MASDDNVEIVTFLFPGPGNRTGCCHMPWRKGRTVQQYLHQQPLRGQGLLGMWEHCKTVNRNSTKVKLYYSPVAGDVIVMRRVKQTM